MKVELRTNSCVVTREANDKRYADFIDDDDILLLEWAGVPEGTRGAKQ